MRPRHPVECQQRRYDGSLLCGSGLVEHQLVGADRFVDLRWVGLRCRTLVMCRTLLTPEPLWHRRPPQMVSTQVAQACPRHIAGRA